ncbi:MAG: SurA N-terminal domain-containing protein [Bacteroidota bacterium]|nr:SurA N-terminal domain-containing protein [Bacteroidota bacterium]
MALIGQIRKKSGILVAIIGIALAAFILGDFVRKSSKGRGELAKINGEKISYHEFDQKVNEQIDNYKKQTHEENVDQATTCQLRQQAWSQMVRDIILQKEYDELGLTVSSAELFDLVQGKEPHAYVVKAFSDPKTGTFDPKQVVQFLKTLDQREPAVREQWSNIEKAIKADRLGMKYSNLIRHGIYITRSQARRDYEDKNTFANGRFILKRYNSVPDKSVSFNDDDIKKYYENHKYEYYQDENTRDIAYVAFDVKPSTEDIAQVEKSIDKIKEGFEKAEKDEDFINANSDTKLDSLFHKKGFFSPLIDSIMFASKTGTIYGPFIENSTYKLIKLLDMQQRPDSLKASHILIAYKGAMGADPQKTTRSKEAAKKIADSVLAILKKAPDQVFESYAKGMSDDPTAKEKAGDLGWFTDGSMVKAFNDACIKGKIGELSVVETGFGYHILKVTDKTKPINKVKVGVISLGIAPSNATYQKIYAQATEFLSKSSNTASFENTVKQEKQNKRLAENVKENDCDIPGLESPRELMRWAYQAKKGDVSKVFDVSGKFVVAYLAEIKPKGILPLDVIRKEIEPLVLKEKKAEKLIKDLTAQISPSMSLEALAQKVNEPIDTLKSFSFAFPNVPKVGPEPELAGNIFALSANKLSKPTKGFNGVFVYFIDNMIKAPATNDFSVYKLQLLDQYQQRGGYEVYKAIEKKSDIKDNRGIFY